MPESVVIIGCGGHGKVCLEILLASGRNVVGFLDDRQNLHGTELHGIPIVGPIEAAPFMDAQIAIGIGDNRSRKMIVQRLLLSEDRYARLIHPHSSVSQFALVQAGAMVGMGACIQPDAVVAEFAIINTAASVDHDCSIGAFAHIAVGAHLAGNVTVGEGAMFGAGASTKPGISIGPWSTIGAGAAVITNVPEGETWAGVPARELRRASHPAT